MKKLLFVLLILSVATSYAQVPSYVPTNGLVAYYPFNGNANDASGNGNNGVVNGATLTGDRNGDTNSAYFFSSSGCSTSINANINTSSIQNGLTISFWVFRSGNGCLSPRIMEFYPGNSGASICVFAIENGAQFPGVTHNLQNNSVVGMNCNRTIDNIWSHIVYTNNGSTANIYQNGILVSTQTCSSNPIISGNVAFGRMNHPSYDAFNGKLDDIAIYNRALSPQEITQLYTGQVIPSYVPTNGLVGYWPFNGNALDESGNGNNGTVNGATLTSDRNNLNQSSYLFSPSSFSYIKTATLATSIVDNFTYSVWVNSYDTTPLPIEGIQANIAKQCVIHPVHGSCFGDYNTNSGSGLYVGKNGIVVIEHSHLFIKSSLVYSASLTGWHLITIAYVNKLPKLYIDGQFIKNGISDTKLVHPSMGYDNNTFGDYSHSGFGVGFNNSSNTSPQFFNGKIDDIAIWNRSLSQQEIISYYNASTPNSCIANITNNDTTICKGASVTLNAAAVNSASVTDINGNVYPTVNIGTQTWIQKNLNVSKYKNGDIIPQVTDATQWANLTTGAWCWYNNDSATYAATYGKLYNWYAVNDPRGLAPNGWHVPSNSEWSRLIKYIDAAADTVCINCNQSMTAGGNLKDTGTLKWQTPNTGATNTTNFTALPGGARFGTSFTGWRATGYWWTNTEFSNNDSYFRILYSINATAPSGYSTNLPINKNNGYSVRCLRNNITYLWSTGATTPSITVSPLVTTTYYCTVSDGVNTCRDSVKITVGATALPTTPAAITGATDVCSYIGADTASVAVNYKCNKVSTASSYLWTVPAGVTLLSGQGDTSVNVRFSASFVSGAISVKSVNVCGVSTSARSLTVYKRVAATPAAIQKEFSPTSIVAVTNVTGLVSETYRIKKVTYATSYNWSMNRGTNATITHINPLGVNDTAVIVTFFNCFVRDTLSVKAVTPCSVSTAKTAILIANTAAASVAGIGTAGGDFAVCIGTNKTFNAIAGTPTSAQAPIASFRWTKPANTTIVSAASDSSSITVSFNTGFTGGSLTAKGVTACGVIGTTTTTAILQYLPPTPLSISSSTNSYNACINSTVTYTAIVGAPTTSQTPTSVFRWTKPNNTTITAASADSSSITLRFNTGYVGGTLSVKGQSRCGTQGGTKSQSLTHTGCAAGTKMSIPITTKTANSFEVSLYPNPSAGEFKLFVNFVGGKTSSMATNLVGGKTPTKATVKVIDLQGRLIKSFECIANRPTAIGNELKPGVYMVEVRMGDEVKTVRAVRF